MSDSAPEAEPVARIEAAKEYVKTLRSYNRISSRIERELLSVLGEYDYPPDDEEAEA